MQQSGERRAARWPRQRTSRGWALVAAHRGALGRLEHRHRCQRHLYKGLSPAAVAAYGQRRCPVDYCRRRICMICDTGALLTR